MSGHRSPPAAEKVGTTTLKVREALVLSMSMIMQQADSHFLAEIDFNIVDMIDLGMDVAMVGKLMEGGYG